MLVSLTTGKRKGVKKLQILQQLAMIFGVALGRLAFKSQTLSTIGNLIVPAPSALVQLVVEPSNWLCEPCTHAFG
jgi:hypothetical protein